MRNEEVDTASVGDPLEKFVSKRCVKEKYFFYCCYHFPLFLTKDTRVWFEH